MDQDADNKIRFPCFRTEDAAGIFRRDFAVRVSIIFRLVILWVIRIFSFRIIRIILRIFFPGTRTVKRVVRGFIFREFPVLLRQIKSVVRLVPSPSC